MSRNPVINVIVYVPQTDFTITRTCNVKYMSLDVHCLKPDLFRQSQFLRQIKNMGSMCSVINKIFYIYMYMYCALYDNIQTPAVHI